MGVVRQRAALLQHAPSQPADYSANCRENNDKMTDKKARYRSSIRYNCSRKTRLLTNGKSGSEFVSATDINFYLYSESASAAGLADTPVSSALSLLPSAH